MLMTFEPTDCTLIEKTKIVFGRWKWPGRDMDKGMFTVEIKKRSGTA